MKQLLITIAAVVLVGCGESQQSASAPEAKPAEPSEPVAEAARPEPPPVKAPDISIHDAALDGNIEAVKQHLAAGTDVNAKDEDGETPLHHAGTKEVTELLIAKGADVNAKNNNGRTPLDMVFIKTKISLTKRRRSEIADLLRKKHGAKTGEELKAAGN
jgi:ankyrin repeat protein